MALEDQLQDYLHVVIMDELLTISQVEERFELSLRTLQIRLNTVFTTLHENGETRTLTSVKTFEPKPNLATNYNTFSHTRADRDSNPGIRKESIAFKAIAFDHSATDPYHYINDDDITFNDNVRNGLGYIKNVNTTNKLLPNRIDSLNGISIKPDVGYTTSPRSL